MFCVCLRGTWDRVFGLAGGVFGWFLLLEVGSWKSGCCFLGWISDVLICFVVYEHA